MSLSTSNLPWLSEPLPQQRPARTLGTSLLVAYVGFVALCAAPAAAHLVLLATQRIGIIPVFVLLAMVFLGPILYFVCNASYELIDGCDPLFEMNFAAFFGTLAITLLVVFGGAHLGVPGWEYITRASLLESKASFIVKNNDALMGHPDNQHLLLANQTLSPKDVASAYAAIKETIEDGDHVNLLVSLAILKADPQRVALSSARGWTTKSERAHWRRWALSNPLPSSASLLQQQAWLRVSGHIELDKKITLTKDEES